MVLTKKEKQVVDALRGGLFLREKQFSDLYEIASSLVSSNRASARFTVSRSVIERLVQKKAIYVANDPVYKRSRYFAA